MQELDEGNQATFVDDGIVDAGLQQCPTLSLTSHEIGNEAPPTTKM